jgi:hypothetical protein
MATIDPRHLPWTVPEELVEPDARTGEGAELAPEALAHLLAVHVRVAALENAEWNRHEDELRDGLEEPSLRPDPAQDDGTPRDWPPA